MGNTAVLKLSLGLFFEPLFVAADQGDKQSALCAVECLLLESLVQSGGKLSLPIGPLSRVERLKSPTGRKPTQTGEEEQEPQLSGSVSFDFDD